MTDVPFDSPSSGDSNNDGKNELTILDDVRKTLSTTTSTVHSNHSWIRTSKLDTIN